MTNREDRIKRVEGEYGPLPIHDAGWVIFLLFEDICPTCCGDVKLVEVSGEKAFLDDNCFGVEGLETQVWKEHDEFWGGPLEPCRQDGCAIFKCENGHDHCVGHSNVAGWC